MSTSRLFFNLIILIGALSLIAAVDAPPPPQNHLIDSVSGSYVYLNSVISPDDCAIRDKIQTFCFQAISYTTDWDYIYYLWLRFPTDWKVQNVYVQGTPYCVNGGTFSDFSFFNFSQNETRISQTRYHANPSDTCTANYCFEVVTGGNDPFAVYSSVSWYWQSSEFGSPPFHPCSSDGYTPIGQPACDSAITPPVYVLPCPHCYVPLVARN